ncbi:hypothetical protein Vadar_030873 [Vaccinium darrowii]|uniref:Uncharacterized protein n=1 Tax=Vaccinium darrowii TaxID=229202 RepID=A0ACB7XDK7_9ERIC|nr:hypothetical protein Vadar_030873 [Vaccinium darrowii]
MNNLPHKIPRKALFAFTILLLTFIPIIKADQYLAGIDCQNATTYDPNSTYSTNLQTLLSVLSSNSNASNGLYNFTAGSSPPDVAYGLFLCQGDLTAAACQDCVNWASTNIVARCPRSKRVTIWYDYCLLRYSNVSMFSVVDTKGEIILASTYDVSNATRLSEVLGQVMYDVADRALSNHSGKKFATEEANYSALQKVYSLAQCTPDLSYSDCNGCLRRAVSRLKNTRIGSRVLYPSCYVRFEMAPFYNISFDAAPPPPSPVLPSPPSTTTPSSPGNGRISPQVIIAIAVSIGVAVMLSMAGFCLLTRRAKKKKYNSLREDIGGDDISAVQSLQYDLGTLQAATNNFSYDNKIGQGGYGPVYKGLLPNGQEVAVKRLSETSGQGALEFKNEVILAWLGSLELIKLRQIQVELLEPLVTCLQNI